MFDLHYDVRRCRENNRLEAKKAYGGPAPQHLGDLLRLCQHLGGGVILLGVEELPDKSLRPIELPDPMQLVHDFWVLVNAPNIASANILKPRHVRVEDCQGKRIVVIRVPRASRRDRPVYVGGDPLTGNLPAAAARGISAAPPDEVRRMFRRAGRPPALDFWHTITNAPGHTTGALLLRYAGGVFRLAELLPQKLWFSISLRPISTPMTDAIIRPRVQPEESPRQCRPARLVSRSVSILTLLE